MFSSKSLLESTLKFTKPWFLALLVPSATLALGCASGKDAPAVTGMVKIETSEAFSYGPEIPCNKQVIGDELCADGFIKDLGEANPEPPLPLKINSFHIDVHEVTNIQYRYCVDMGGCSTPPLSNNGALVDQTTNYHKSDDDKFDNYPVVWVTREMAQEYCGWVGKRLPTEFEWERVAKGSGDKKRIWPVEQLGADIAACSSLGLPTGVCGVTGDAEAAPKRGGDGNYLAPVEQDTNDYVLEPGGAIYHLFGNVSEWTSSKLVSRPTCFGELPAGCVPTHECPSLTDTCACTGLCEAPGQCDDWRNAPPPPEVDQCLYAPGESPATSQKCFYRCVDTDRTLNASPICQGPEFGVEYTLADLPLDQDTSSFVIKGGSADLNDPHVCYFLSSARDMFTFKNIGTKKVNPFIGFRCAMDGAETPPKGYEYATFPE